MRRVVGCERKPATSNGLLSELTDEHWSLTADLFPDQSVARQGGRPRINSQDCFEGIIWVLLRGARGTDLPVAVADYVPNVLIDDKAAESDKLRDRLAARNVKLIGALTDAAA